MEETDIVVNCFKENDAHDPISFFRWMGFKYQNDKQRAHSLYHTLMFKAANSPKWKRNADLMRKLWKKSVSNGSIAGFWKKLPKKSSDNGIQQVHVK